MAVAPMPAVDVSVVLNSTPSGERKNQADAVLADVLVASRNGVTC